MKFMCGFFFNKISLYSDILLKKNHLSRLFCCNHTCHCVNMASVTSASRYITSASRYPVADPGPLMLGVLDRWIPTVNVLQTLIAQISFHI